MKWGAFNLDRKIFFWLCEIGLLANAQAEPLSLKPITPSVANESMAEGFAVPDMSKFEASTAKVDENLSWNGIRRYKIENGYYQIELKGTLASGRLLPHKTQMQKFEQNKWLMVNHEELIDRHSFESILSGDEFNVLLKLPRGKFEILLYAKVDGRILEYPFQMEPDETWPEAPPPALNLFLCSKCVEFGAGLNYLSLNHSNVSSLSAISYSAIAFSSLSIQYRQRLSRIAGLRFSYAQNPGANFSSDGITLNHPSVNFTTISFGYDKVTKPNGILFGANYSSGYLIGLQNFKFPLIRSVSLADLTFRNEPFSLTSLSAGGFFGLNLGGNSEIIGQIRFQMPLLASGVSLKKGLSFDGAITYLNQLSNLDTAPNETSLVPRGAYWGLNWSGQYHSYSYDLSDDGIKNGIYSEFLSKLEALIGFRF